MMTPEQRKIVVQTYNHLMDTESRGWNSLDDYMDFLEYLDDDQLHREADVIYSKHYQHKVRCEQSHSKENCFIPVLVEACGAILELFKETGELHEKNRYILYYYLAMDQAKMIIVED